MKFSIVTVVYNARRELEETVNSIQNQSYKYYEHVIIDAASNDGTLELIQSLSSEHIEYISEKDNGIYDGMNKGIDLACGDYLLFLNAGDTFANDDVLKNVANSIDHNSPKVIYGDANIYSKHNKFITRLDSLVFNKENLNKYGTRVVCHQSIFVHRTVSKKYSEKYKLKGELDWYYYLNEEIDIKSITKVNFVICNYFLGGIGDKNFWRDFYERIKVTKEHNKNIEFFLVLPYLIMPMAFRLKRAIFRK